MFLQFLKKYLEDNSSGQSPTTAKLIINEEWSDDHYTDDLIPEGVVDQTEEYDT